MMRNTFRKSDGFSLLEMVVTLVAASLITLAAVTVLLLGVRINAQSMGTASRQTTTRILLSSLEDMASEGTIASIASDADGWIVYSKAPDPLNNIPGEILYTFKSADQAIYSGTSGTAIMEGVYASYVELNGRLLTFSVETEEGSYTSSIYCRTVEIAEEGVIENVPMPDTESEDSTVEKTDIEYLFLQKLASQYTIDNGNGIKIANTGMILKDGEIETPVTYYSQWYIGDGWGKNGWSASTPWCACFISWGLDQVWEENNLLGDPPRFANVDNFMNDFKSKGTWEPVKSYGVTYEPNPGDLIFFDWKINNVQNPEHIGAVIKVAEETVNGQKVKFVYTIEGNSSNRVAVRKYSITDPRIIGYGVIKWPDEGTGGT